MQTVVVTKNKYQELIEKSLRYEYLRQIIIEDDIFNSPPTQNVKEIVSAFKETDRYNEKFLKSLKKGLECSSYFKK